MTRRRLVALCAVACAVLLGLSGCGGTDDGGTGATETEGVPPPETEPETVIVPNVTGDPADEAQSDIEAVGDLTVAWDPEEPGDRSACIVESQDTEGEADPSAEVLLTVTCEPPDVTGMDGQEAVDTLEEAGFSWAVDDCSDRLAECTVADQDPISDAEPGSEVSLTMETEGPGPGPGPGACHESYPDECLDPDVEDYDCSSGEGDGPEYVTGPITVDHAVSDPDPFDLDRDGDGTGCDAG